jgi:hypothetical protein
MYYKQLVKVPNLANIEPINLHIQYGKNDEQGVFRGIQYYTALGNFALAYDVIPERYRTDFPPCLCPLIETYPHIQIVEYLQV